MSEVVPTELTAGELDRYAAQPRNPSQNGFCPAMTLERKIASAFRMDDETWKRHANPWSVWTRNTVLPLLILAFWSRAWLKWWSLLPIAAALLWTWLNPRLFSAPKSMDSWAARGVLGERVWLNRDEVPVPEYHRTVPNILSGISAVGAVFVVWGVVALEVWPTVFGAVTVILTKLWFVDRMVWLYEDMRKVTPEYSSWASPEQENAA